MYACSLPISGERKIKMCTKMNRSTTTWLILCFFVILIVFLSSSPAVFGRPTGSSGNSKIGVGPGHSSTAPSAVGQRSPTKQSSSGGISYRALTRSTAVCASPGRYSNCVPRNPKP